MNSLLISVMGDWLWLHMLYLETLSLFKLIVVENVIGFRASRGPRKQTPLQPAGQAWSPKRTYLSCPHPYPSREYTAVRHGCEDDFETTLVFVVVL